MKLLPQEIDLVGQWIAENGQVRRDATCERIEWLTKHSLRKVAISPQWGAWETLFQDPDDGRYWEQTYPQSGMHGGGPPRLIMLSTEVARTKYLLDQIAKEGPI
jgi:hypothetical protein